MTLVLSVGCTGEINGVGPTGGAGSVSGATGAVGGTAGSGNGAAAGGPSAGGSGAVTGGNPGSGGGSVSGGAGGSGAGLGSGATGGSAAAGTLDATSAGPLPLRHLTSREYRNTVYDLIGDTSIGEHDVPSETTDPTFEYFPFRRPGSVGVIEAEALQFAAEQVARGLVGAESRLLPCSPSGVGESACAAQFIADFGKRAYRRPLDAGEVTRLTALYERARAELALDFNGAVGLLVEAILQSPAFYYHFEREAGPAAFDVAANVVALGPYQLASRMSYFLWGSMPDTELFAAAESGAIMSELGVETQARRMLVHPRARETLADFFDDLFDLDVLVTRSKDTEEYPAYDTELQAAMRAEIGLFATRAVFDGAGTFRALFTSTQTVLNGPLAELYGVSGVNGQAFVNAELHGAERGGLLTLAGFLANSASANGSLPPRRGKFVYTRMLCTDLPPPPPDVPSPAEPSEGMSTRQRFDVHGQNPCAAGCHAILDGLGFAFENYDGIGAFRSTDMGVPVDASGSFAFDGVNPVSYQNATELGQVLADDAGAQACFSRQWLRYALRRSETDGDAFSLEGARSAFVASGGDVRELLVALARSRTFRYRTPAAGEVLQ